MLIEQCKSSVVGDKNPVSNSSLQLWKTFANWAEHCLKHGIDPDQCVFRLYVTPSNTGPLVTLMDAAKVDKDALAALKKVKAFAKTKDPGVGCEPELSKFLATGDELCRKIISGFELKPDNEPRDAIRDRFVANIQVELIDDLCAAVVGLARTRVDEKIEKGEAPIVQTSPFRKQWQAYLRKHHMGGLLVSKTPLPSLSQIAALAQIRPIFVRQLEVIKARDDIVTQAISSYLRAIADKTHWAEEGILVKESFDEFDLSLEHRFTTAKDEIADTLSAHDEQARGRALYRMCINTQFSIEEHSLLEYFVCGAYNSLADERRVGWHSKYEDLCNDD
jgi:hypothetical protein